MTENNEMNFVAAEAPRKPRRRKSEKPVEIPDGGTISISDFVKPPEEESILESIAGVADGPEAQAGGGGGEPPAGPPPEAAAELPAESGGSEIARREEPKAKISGKARITRLKSLRVPDGLKRVCAVIGRKLFTPVAIGMFLMMFAAIFFYLYTQWSNARELLAAGPARAYQMEKDGDEERARQLWIQINAKSPWYDVFSGLFTDIDSPYLQKASLAYKAGDWPNVAENAYKALQVPITNQQAVYVQQMILTATANMVKAYLPNQQDQPIRGGVPDHAPPVCEPSSTYIWVVPALLVAMAGICLYGRMKIAFAIVALLMPLYFWGVNAYNKSSVGVCEMRLNFNPAHIELYDMKPVQMASKADLATLRVEPAPRNQPPEVPSAPAAPAADAPQPKVESAGATPADLEKFVHGESAFKISQGNAPAQPKPAPPAAPKK